MTIEKNSEFIKATINIANIDKLLEWFNRSL